MPAPCCSSAVKMEFYYENEEGERKEIDTEIEYLNNLI